MGEEGASRQEGGVELGMGPRVGAGERREQRAPLQPIGSKAGVVQRRSVLLGAHASCVGAWSTHRGPSRTGELVVVEGQVNERRADLAQRLRHRPAQLVAFKANCRQLSLVDPQAAGNRPWWWWMKRVGNTRTESSPHKEHTQRRALELTSEAARKLEIQYLQPCELA